MKWFSLVISMSMVSTLVFAQHVKAPSAIFESVSPSVVTVYAANGKGMQQGSAVAFSSSHGIASANVPPSTSLITNAHVVGSASTVKVRIGSQEYDAAVMGIDDELDLALLNVKALVLPRLTTASGTPRTGETVYAIGSPLGLEKTLSSGLVSAVRSRNAVTLIQSTAAISPGSSGGGLFNDKGQLIGITSSKLTLGEGLGFSIGIQHTIDMRETSRAASYLHLAAKTFPDFFQIDIQRLRPTSSLAKWLRKTTAEDGRPMYLIVLEANEKMRDMISESGRAASKESFDKMRAVIQQYAKADTTSASQTDTSRPSQGDTLTLECDFQTDGGGHKDRRVYSVDFVRSTVNNEPAQITEQSIILNTGKEKAIKLEISRYTGKMIGSFNRDEGRFKVGDSLFSGQCTAAKQKLF